MAALKLTPEMEKWILEMIRVEKIMADGEIISDKVALKRAHKRWGTHIS